MKKVLLGLIMLSMATVANAQCVAEVKDVVIDEQRGSIVVKTEYKLNGVIVDVHANPSPTAIGQTRYTEESGTVPEIVAKAKEDINQHCENLIIRNAANVNNLNAVQLDIVKSLTTPLIATLKENAVGWTKTVTQKVIQFKNKEITIEASGAYSVADLP